MALETKLNLEPETLAALQELIRMNVDSRDGFRYAAEKVDDLTLQETFWRLADERDAQADELCHYVEWNCEEPRKTGSYAAALHRTWIAIREMTSADHTGAILSEAERGEDQIKEAYENVLVQTAGSAMNDLLMDQLRRVKSAHDLVRELRDAWNDTSR